MDVTWAGLDKFKYFFHWHNFTNRPCYPLLYVIIYSFIVWLIHLLLYSWKVKHLFFQRKHNMNNQPINHPNCNTIKCNCTYEPDPKLEEPGLFFSLSKSARYTRTNNSHCFFNTCRTLVQSLPQRFSAEDICQRLETFFVVTSGRVGWILASSE